MRFIDGIVSRETGKRVRVLSPFASGDIIAALAR
jgi:hypothetical protein